jgi:hypothetical protein
MFKDIVGYSGSEIICQAVKKMFGWNLLGSIGKFQNFAFVFLPKYKALMKPSTW